MRKNKWTTPRQSRWGIKTNATDFCVVPCILTSPDFGDISWLLLRLHIDPPYSNNNHLSKTYHPKASAWLQDEGEKFLWQLYFTALMIFLGAFPGTLCTKKWTRFLSNLISKKWISNRSSIPRQISLNVFETDSLKIFLLYLIGQTKWYKSRLFVVTLMDMFTHIHKATYLYATPQTEPRGILLIKDKDGNFWVADSTGYLPGH